MSRVHPSGCPTDIKNYLLCAFGTVIFSNFDNMERSLYESRLKVARDEYARVKWAKKKGLMEGRAECEARMSELFALLESGVSLEEAKKQLKLS